MTTQEVGLRCENFAVGIKVEARRVGPPTAALQCPHCLYGPCGVVKPVCVRLNTVDLLSIVSMPSDFFLNYF